MQITRNNLDTVAGPEDWFFSDGRLTSIPVKRKRRVGVLQRLMSGFEAGRDYSESDVNTILGRSHDDVATLRRELVGYGFMNRTRNTYRVASELPSRDATVAQEVPPDERAWLAALIETAKAQDTPRADRPLRTANSHSADRAESHALWRSGRCAAS